jgi:hypothetical protein
LIGGLLGVMEKEAKKLKIYSGLEVFYNLILKKGG